MCICSNAHITRKYCVSDDVFNVPLGISSLYIYDGKFSEIYEISNGFLFISLSLHREFFFRSLKVE